MLHFTYFNIMGPVLANILGMVLGQVIQSSGDPGSQSGIINQLLQNEINKKVKDNGKSESKPKVVDDFKRVNLF